MKKILLALSLFTVRPLMATPVEDKVVEIHMTFAADTTDLKVTRNKKALLPFPGHGTCSGSFVTATGDILTAKHCVDGVDQLDVQTADRKMYRAVVVATSTAHDLALIHIDRRDTPFFVVASSVTRGERITVLGSPLSITDTMSVGIIARLDGDILLMDCSAIPGNSGGPVFNANEELVGVVSAGFIVLFGTTHLNMAQGTDAVYYFLKKALKEPK